MSPGVERRLVETRFGMMHVRFSAGSSPPLVALHMTPLSSRMWLALMERLARRVVAPDRLGFGLSDPPPTEPTMTMYGQATLDAIDALGLERFDLLGEHTGSVEAVEIASLAPDRVRAIALVALPVYSGEERVDRVRRRGRPPPAPREDGSHLTDAWQRRRTGAGASRPLTVLHRNTVDELLSSGPHLAYRAVFDYPMAERLGKVGHPLVVFAPHDDLFDQTRRARGLLPSHAAYVELPGLGYDIFDVEADRMAALISEHLGET